MKVSPRECLGIPLGACHGSLHARALFGVDEADEGSRRFLQKRLLLGDKISEFFKGVDIPNMSILERRDSKKKT